MGYVGKVIAGGTTHLVGSTLLVTCSTAAATAAKVGTCSDFSSLENGVTIHVLFNSGNTASNPTLNVNSKGAKSIQRAGGESIGNLKAGAMVSLTYDSNSGIWKVNEEGPLPAEDSTAKMFLLGTTADATDYVDKAYWRSSVYATNGDLHASKFNSYTLAAACAKAVDTSIAVGSSSANLPTSAAVAAYVTSQMGDIAGAMVYKGTVTAESQLLNTALSKGWYYVVAMPNAQTTSITIAGEACEAGDMVIVNTSGTYTSSTLAAATDIIQTNTAIITNAEIDTIVAS